MPRLTIKFLVKCFVVVLGFLFLLPLLMNKIDSQESQNQQKKKPVVKRDLEQQIKEFDLHQNQADDDIFPQKQNDKENKIERLPDGPFHEISKRKQKIEKVEAPAGHEVKKKVFGPKAVFKEGILGNYEPEIKPKRGPGEGGEPVYVSMNEQTAADRSVREFGFNMVASDKISMNRTIPDTRMDECKYWNYPSTSQLPTASVILVFHNEGWSTLVRTVHSVIDTSPPELLKEVVMVDDFSDKEHLKGKLEEYLRVQFKGKVKLFRNPERLGLIKTRTMGAKYSEGDVIVFLDAHCECNRNWLVPLLARIAYDRTIMAVPVIDGIDWNNFRYNPVYQAGQHFRGIFEWGFLYKESQVPRKELGKREQDSQPYWSPTHAGGLFAMDRDYFFELGAYDDGLQIWGGENFELSFKIWQCGGSIEWVPCSRVGHVYRNHMPYGFGKVNPKIPIILLNYMRVVEVWLDDEFKEYFYTREPTIRGYPIGNITSQLELKKRLNCKSFKWFMDNIAYEVYEKFPPPPPNQAWGEIKERNGFNCWDTLGQQAGGGEIGVSTCHHFGGNQLFRLNTKGQMALGERCLDSRNGKGITIIYCPVQPTGPWIWDESNGTIKHEKHSKCVQADTDTRKLVLRTCDSEHQKQQWDINEVRTWS